LKELYLKNNKFYDEGAISLADGVKDSKCLKIIDISYCRI